MFTRVIKRGFTFILYKWKKADWFETALRNVSFLTSIINIFQIISAI